MTMPNWLRKPLGIFGWVTAIFIAVISILLCFAIDNSPQEILIQGLTRQDIDRAKQILRVQPEEHDAVKHLSLDSKDLNIAVGYLLSHYIENTTAIRFLPNKLWFQIALFVPQSPWGHYLDISFTLRQGPQNIFIKSLKLGEISIPDPVANRLIPFIVHHSRLQEYWQLGQQYIQSVRLTETTLEIDYLTAIVDDVKRLAVRKHHDYPSLPFYQQQINDIVSQHDPAWRLSLNDIMQPLFKQALQRSHEANVIQENKAIILAVASYIFKGELRSFLPLGLVFNKEYPAFAYKRIDIPEHFIASAMVAALGTSTLSQQLGLDKEVGDSQRGSGFSFVDINSDKTGSLFGQLACNNVQSAFYIQQQMAQAKDYTSFIPDPQGLPEEMDQQSFVAQYTSTESDAYKTMIAEIDSRIRALKIYQSH